MMLTLLAVTSVSLGLAAVFVLTKGHEAALAGENTVVGLADPAADTMTSDRHQATGTRTDWQLTTVSALSAAEELLDVLEYQGYTERELVVLGNSSFAVRWR